MGETLDRVTAAIEGAESLDAPARRMTDYVSTALELAPVGGGPYGSGRPARDVVRASVPPRGGDTADRSLDSRPRPRHRRDARAREGSLARKSGRHRLAAGAAGAVIAAASGLADWRQVHGRERRTGLAHAALNSGALGLTLGSLALRRRGRRGTARALSAAGWMALMAGAYLGGHLVYRRGIGTDHSDRSPEPREFVPVIALAELEEDRLRRVAVPDPASRSEVGIVLVRHRGGVHALGSRCAHMGGPLHEGWVKDGGVVCPWHGSRFCLASGRVLNGPATAPQPRYAVRVRDGLVEVRREQEAGDEVRIGEDIARAAAARSPSAPPRARKADEVLFKHHELLRVCSNGSLPCRPTIPSGAT